MNPTQVTDQRAEAVDRDAANTHLLGTMDGGFRTRQALVDLDRAAGTGPQPDAFEMAFDPATAAKSLWPAAAALLRQALAHRRLDPFLIDLWLQRQPDMRAAPAPIRAALMNGFDRLCDLQLLPEDCEPMAPDLVTFPRQSIEPAPKTLAGDDIARDRPRLAR